MRAFVVRVFGHFQSLSKYSVSLDPLVFFLLLRLCVILSFRNGTPQFFFLNKKLHFCTSNVIYFKLQHTIFYRYFWIKLLLLTMCRAINSNLLNFRNKKHLMLCFMQIQENKLGQCWTSCLILTYVNSCFGHFHAIELQITGHIVPIPVGYRLNGWKNIVDNESLHVDVKQKAEKNIFHNYNVCYFHRLTMGQRCLFQWFHLHDFKLFPTNTKNQKLRWHFYWVAFETVHFCGGFNNTLPSNWKSWIWTFVRLVPTSILSETNFTPCQENFFNESVKSFVSSDKNPTENCLKTKPMLGFINGIFYMNCLSLLNAYIIVIIIIVSARFCSCTV